MKNLMLAGLDREMADQLHSILGQQYRIHHCTSGPEVQFEFTALLPELLVVDLTMPGCDTIGLLRAVQARCGQTQALVIAYAWHDHIQTQLSMVNTAFLLIRPITAATIAERILQLEQILPEISARDRADEILRDMGLDSHSAGFSCLCAAIGYKYDHPDCLYTGELCISVAKRCGGTGPSVDKAMTRCIRKAARRMDPALWSVYLGSAADTISCAQFIRAIAQYIKSVE